MSMSRDGTRPLAGQMGDPDDPYGVKTPTDSQRHYKALRDATKRLLAAVDGSPGAIETADAVNEARAALAQREKASTSAALNAQFWIAELREQGWGEAAAVISTLRAAMEAAYAEMDGVQVRNILRAALEDTDV